MVVYGWLAGLRRKAIVSGITFRELRVMASASTDYPYLDISFMVDSNTTANLIVRRFVLPIYRASWQGQRVEATPRFDGIPARLPARQNTRVSFKYRPPSSFWFEDADTVDIMGGILEADTLWGIVSCSVNLGITQQITNFSQARKEYLARLKGWLVG